MTFWSACLRRPTRRQREDGTVSDQAPLQKPVETEASSVANLVPSSPGAQQLLTDPGAAGIVPGIPPSPLSAACGTPVRPIASTSTGTSPCPYVAAEPPAGPVRVTSTNDTTPATVTVSADPAAGSALPAAPSWAGSVSAHVLRTSPHRTPTPAAAAASTSSIGRVTPESGLPLSSPPLPSLGEDGDEDGDADEGVDTGVYVDRRASAPPERSALLLPASAVGPAAGILGLSEPGMVDGSGQPRKQAADVLVTRAQQQQQQLEGEEQKGQQQGEGQTQQEPHRSLPLGMPGQVAVEIVSRGEEEKEVNEKGEAEVAAVVQEGTRGQQERQQQQQQQQPRPERQRPAAQGEEEEDRFDPDIAIAAASRTDAWVAGTLRRARPPPAKAQVASQAQQQQPGRSSYGRANTSDSNNNNLSTAIGGSARNLLTSQQQQQQLPSSRKALLTSQPSSRRAMLGHAPSVRQDLLGMALHELQDMLESAAPSQQQQQLRAFERGSSNSAAVTQEEHEELSKAVRHLLDKVPSTRRLTAGIEELHMLEVAPSGRQQQGQQQGQQGQGGAAALGKAPSSRQQQQQGQVQQQPVVLGKAASSRAMMQKQKQLQGNRQEINTSNRGLIEGVDAEAGRTFLRVMKRFSDSGAAGAAALVAAGGATAKPEFKDAGVKRCFQEGMLLGAALKLSAAQQHQRMRVSQSGRHSGSGAGGGRGGGGVAGVEGAQAARRR